MQNDIDILLVEDNSNDAELTIRALKKHNLANNIIHLKDGEQVLEYLLNDKDEKGNALQQPRLILLDLKMPKVNGIEVLRQIKSNILTKHIPVVILTSSTMDPDIKECYELGVNSYVVKPVEFEEFIKVVSELGLYWMLVNKHPY